ncbi:MAG: hypothetical protein JO115_22895 [Pseudonocardiales bacterium]|nr:hypothetical protein [Pseudonocardiales bacterium]
MAAIPATRRARYAPDGVLRALSRALVLGGLVVAGWLLGSGIGLAEENLGQPVTGPAQVVSSPGGNDLTGTDPGSSTTAASTVTAVRSLVAAPSAVSAPWRSVAPLVKLGPLVKLDGAQPIVGAAGVSSPLVRALTGRIPLPLSRPIQDRAGVRSHALDEKPAPLPPAQTAQPAMRAAAAPAPAPTLGAPTRPTVVDRVPPAAPVHATAPTAQPSFQPAAPGDDPAAPSPLPSTTSAGMASGTGSGAGTKGAPDVAVRDRWATSGPALLHRLRYLSASDLPWSPAAQPGTSPD